MAKPIPTLALITEPSQHRVVAGWYSSTGSPTSTYYTEKEFLKALENIDVPALIVVGWNAQNPANSASLLENVTKLTDACAYIVSVSDSTQEEDIVSALMLGADRFLSSNTSFRVITAMLNALLKPTNDENEILHFPPYKLNVMTREVVVEGNFIQLTPGEFRIAQYLFENSHSILSREIMLREVWGLPNLEYNRRVDTKISHIRRKMHLDGTYGWQLTYPRGQGYQLMQNAAQPEIWAENPTGPGRVDPAIGLV